MRRRLLLAVLVTVSGCGAEVLWDGTIPTPPVIPIPVVVVEVTPPSFAGLPCDVKGVLQNRCTSCHGPTLAAGAPYPLASLTDLHAVAMTDADGGTQSRGHRSVVRMAEGTMPPPPDTATPAELGVLGRWVDAGMPAGTCAAPAVVCTGGAGQTSDRARDNMRPGEACATCHARQGEGPQDQFMGTLYPSLHERDDCNGAPPAGTYVVEILDASTGAVSLTLQVASPSGNFRGNGPIPYRARVRNTVTGRVREMVSPQNEGDCNLCHTALGARGAPGRIAWPN